ncbi:patatin-like phospholipase family protein [Flavobacterium sp. JAS]|uniref:patatin-like phospholipase family protein n=1 Tax=Flavobacterium sp. JAS TaxID=2897329 RepID=UPI001E5F684E|nr:patatin-like phospholipase family protein [Flavobacterium sp. JAS]MCD0470358.1 patatin-like phospholipase family protein [Flavobacterium sp. JAS]
MSKILILTVDGGGIKGIIPSYFLEQLESASAMGLPCYQIFDIIGGTSTGGIIATALTSPLLSNGTEVVEPMTASDIFAMYKNNGDKIFVSQEFADFKYVSLYYGDDGNGNGIEPYLQSIYQSYSLNDAKNNMEQVLQGRTKHVFTTSYTINSSGGVVNKPQKGSDYGPYLFNWLDASNPSDDYLVWEAARATSAAPTFFPVANLGGGQGANSQANERWALDGGVMSNNPAIWAISEAFRTQLVSSLSDIVLVSLGTGTYPGGAGLVTAHQGDPDPDNGNWGEAPWLASDLYDLTGVENGDGAIIKIITEAVQLVSSQQILGLESSGLSYYRLEPTITQAQSQMDNISKSNVDSLIQTATDYLNGTEGSAIFTAIVNELTSIIDSNSEVASKKQLQ